jgi:diacylglycerol kinase family enzyme
LPAKRPPYDGKIVIRILKGSSKWALAKKWARIALGVPFGPSDLEVIRVPELTIDSVPQQYVAVNGEVITQTPIRVWVAREALRLMTGLSPACHPAMGRVAVTFEPKVLGGATGRGAEPSV